MRLSHAFMVTVCNPFSISPHSNPPFSFVESELSLLGNNLIVYEIPLLFYSLLLLLCIYHLSDLHFNFFIFSFFTFSVDLSQKILNSIKVFS